MGISFPQARAAAIKELASAKGITGDIDQILSSPNSILALDYLLALIKFDWEHKINVIMIKREGEGYHSSDISSEFTSATAIRNAISEEAPVFSQSAIATKLNGHMPDLALGVMLSSCSSGIFRFPDYVDYMRSTMLTAAASSSLDTIAYMSDDLSGYIKNFANDIRPKTIPDDDYGLKSFESKVSTKRYTLSRIMRALASMNAGQDNSYLDIKRPPYVRVLGFNK